MLNTFYFLFTFPAAMSFPIHSHSAVPRYYYSNRPKRDTIEVDLFLSGSVISVIRSSNSESALARIMWNSYIMCCRVCLERLMSSLASWCSFDRRACDQHTDRHQLVQDLPTSNTTTEVVLFDSRDLVGA